MKIIGSATIITVLMLLSLEMKLTPLVKSTGITIPIHNVSEPPADAVVVYLVIDSREKGRTVEHLKYYNMIRTCFSGFYEHPLGLGEPPEYIFSKVLFSAYIGPNSGSYPTDISFTLRGDRFTKLKLEHALKYFKKQAYGKEIYLIEFHKGSGNNEIFFQKSRLLNETFKIFPESRTTVMMIAEDATDGKKSSLKFSSWGRGAVNMMRSGHWRPEDVAVLIAGLLGVQVPSNSVGRTPEDLMKLPEPSMAQIRAENSLHLASACVSTSTRHNPYSPFKFFIKSLLNKCDLMQYIEEILSSLRNENYELLRMMTKHLEDRSLRCILQYKTLCVTFTVIFGTTITFLWIYILIISFIVLEEITEYYNRTVMLFTIALHVIFYLLTVACAYAVFQLSWPYRYIMYLALIVILFWIALIHSSYIFNFVPMNIKSYVLWILMFYFALNEIVFWSWEMEYMVFVLLIPYVSAEWIYKLNAPLGKYWLSPFVHNLSLLILCYLNFIKNDISSVDKYVLEILSQSCWILVGFPLVYRYRANPFVLTPILLTQAILVYLLAMTCFQPVTMSNYLYAISWWLLTGPVVIFCLTDRNPLSVLLIGYATSVPVLLLSGGFESFALLILFIHMYSWYTLETVPEPDSFRKVARGVGLYIYMFLCHIFTKGEVQIGRFTSLTFEHSILFQFLKIYKQLLPSLLLCFLWAVLHKIQNDSFSKSVKYVLMLCVSVSFRHFISVVVDENKMESLLINYIFHLNCLLSLFVTKALFKDYKIPFGYFVPLLPNKKLYVVTKFVRPKIQLKNEHYLIVCLFNFF